MTKKAEYSHQSIWIMLTIILFSIVATGTVLYFAHQNQLYVETDIATLQVDQVSVTSPQTGKLTNWTVQTGSKVKKDDRLGTEEIPVTTASLQSTNSNSSTESPSNHQQPIQAPIDGTVIQNKIKPGQFVEQGQTLATIADLSKVYVEAYIDESDIKEVRVDKEVDVTFDAYPDQMFSGKVEKVGNSAGQFDNGPNPIYSSKNDKKEVQRVPVKIRLDDFSIERPVVGLSATVKIHK